MLLNIGFCEQKNLLQSLSFSCQAFSFLGLLLLTVVASREKIMLVKGYISFLNWGVSCEGIETHE